MRSSWPGSGGESVAARFHSRTSRRGRGAGPGIRLSVAVAATILLVVACGGPGGAPGGQAEEFPTRPITLIVPLPAGSAPDGTFRKLASIAEEEIGRQITIINRPGGAGTVGTVDVLNARPDGYTIGMVGVAMVTLQPKVQDTAYQGPEDLTPLVQVTEAAMSLFVNANSDLRTVDDLVNRAKNSPGRVTIGVAGARDLTDIEGRLLAREAGVEMKTVPMGPGKQVLGVINGTVVAGIAQPLIVKPHVDSGKLRFLGIFGEKAPPGVDAELVTDQGYDVTQIPYEFLIAPKGLPDDIRDRLVEIFGEAVQSQEFQDFAQDGGLIVSYLGPDKLDAKLAQDDEFYTMLIEEFGWS